MIALEYKLKGKAQQYRIIFEWAGKLNSMARQAEA
jgi:hypothetical protein